MAASNPVSGERKGTFKVEFLKDIERKMQARSHLHALSFLDLIIFLT